MVGSYYSVAREQRLGRLLATTVGLSAKRAQPY